MRSLFSRVSRLRKITLAAQSTTRLNIVDILLYFFHVPFDGRARTLVTRVQLRANPAKMLNFPLSFFQQIFELCFLVSLDRRTFHTVKIQVLLFSRQCFPASTATANLDSLRSDAKSE